MNTRGVLIFEVGIWIVRIVMVMIILMGIALLIRTYVNAKVNMDLAEPALFMQILSTSPEFLVQDALSGSVRAIDVDRFKTANLDSRLAFRQRHAASKLILLEQDKKPIVTIYLNKPYYDELASQVPRLLGKTVIMQARDFPVTLVEQGKSRKGVLHVEVLQPR